MNEKFEGTPAQFLEAEEKQKKQEERIEKGEDYKKKLEKFQYRVLDGAVKGLPNYSSSEREALFAELKDTDKKLKDLGLEDEMEFIASEAGLEDDINIERLIEMTPAEFIEEVKNASNSLAKETVETVDNQDIDKTSSEFLEAEEKQKKHNERIEKAEDYKKNLEKFQSGVLDEAIKGLPNYSSSNRESLFADLEDTSSNLTDLGLAEEMEFIANKSGLEDDINIDRLLTMTPVEFKKEIENAKDSLAKNE